MNDLARSHAYGDRVRFEIAESDLASFRRATDFLNVGGFDVLSLQHEYGIFGGKAGSHILALLSKVRMPIVTTLHTILGEPTVEQRRVMDEVTRLSEPFGRDEPLRRRALARSARGAGRQDRLHPPRDPDLAEQSSEQEAPGRRGHVADPHLRPALAGQRDRIRHRCAPRDRRTSPDRGLRRRRRHAPPREGVARRDLPAQPRAPGPQARRGGARRLSRSLRERIRARRVFGCDRHLHHPVPEPGADHFRDTCLRAGQRESGRFDALSIRARAAGGRPRPPRSVQRFVCNRARR